MSRKSHIYTPVIQKDQQHLFARTNDSNCNTNGYITPEIVNETNIQQQIKLNKPITTMEDLTQNSNRTVKVD